MAWWRRSNKVEEERPVQVVHTNSADGALRSRIASAVSGGYDFADTMHNVYLDFGYPQSVTFANLWNMYRRFGIAKNAIELPVDACWSSPPQVVGTDQFNTQLAMLIEATRLWQRLKGLDTRQRVGRYAGLFMRVRDGLPASEPLKGQLAGLASLMEVVPLFEGQLRVTATDTNPMSDNYNRPMMYQYTTAEGNRNEQAAASFQIHPSRLVLAAEGADDGSIYGVPAIESCYNSLMDLRKIVGAGGEGFYRNAAQSIVFNLKDTASANVNTELLEKFNEVFDEFTKNRQRRGLWTPGLDANALESTLVSPEHFFQNALQDVAASVKIPATILIGQQTGRLASNEDSRSFLAGMNSRRNNFLSELVRDVVDWCITYGVLPSSSYTISWSDLLAMSTKEKLDNARELSNINREVYQAGGAPPFEEGEIRELAGYEVFAHEQIELPGESDIDG